jgi:hypothetical protein
MYLSRWHGTDAERKVIATGKNPSDARRAERKAQANTFEAVAREWLGKHGKEVSPGTLRRDKARLESCMHSRT